MIARLVPTTTRRKTRLGTFYTDCTVANVADERKSARVPKLLVDTGSECTWVPAAVLDKIGIKPRKKDMVFQMANGQTISRSIGFAVVRVGEYLTVDEVVFAQPGDLLLLGARTLEGLNLVVDARNKRLVASGPRPAAVARVIKEGKVRTYDMGGKASTLDVAKEVARYAG